MKNKFRESVKNYTCQEKRIHLSALKATIVILANYVKYLPVAEWWIISIIKADMTETWKQAGMFGCKMSATVFGVNMKIYQMHPHPCYIFDIVIVLFIVKFD